MSASGFACAAGSRPRREHGEHLAFVDLRDHSGVTQCVVGGSVEARSEWVLQVEGTVRRRPAGNENPELPTGDVELADCNVEVLARAEPPPFAVDDRVESDESVRLRYRYVDLRRPRMQGNLRLRSRVLTALREAMLREGFCEVETPLLWTPTPEGAREFAVPARLHRGEFYVLPQSPQIAKQLLMVGGVDRYFQMARCLRDEDLRADRQFEFTQLDVEASFVSASDVREAVTEAVVDATEAAVGERPGEVKSISWQEAMDRYGVDKPDMRFEMELVDLGEVFAGTEVRAMAAQCVKGLRVPAGAQLSRNRVDVAGREGQAARREGPGIVQGGRHPFGRGAGARVGAREVPLCDRAARASSRPQGRCRATSSSWSPTRGARPVRCSGSCAWSSVARLWGRGAGGCAG